MSHFEIIAGDITQAKVDAIVNAANSIMLGGGGVDGAIHRAAGPELLEACKNITVTNGIRCPTGEARITSAGRLTARHVIHTVGPIYATDSNPAGMLTSAYRSALKLALENDCESVAFPAISCGVYGYPYDEAAKIALAVCSQRRYSKLIIYFYLFGNEIISAWNHASMISQARHHAPETGR